MSDMNEQIARAVANSKEFKFPREELVPRWVVAHVRKKMVESAKEINLTIEEAFICYTAVRMFFDENILNIPSSFQEMKELAKMNPFFSAVFRDDTLHIFKETTIRERNGDVMVEGESLDSLMSLIIHEDWRQDYEGWREQDEDTSSWSGANNSLAFVFRWEVLYGFSKDAVIRTYGD